MHQIEEYIEGQSFELAEILIQLRRLILSAHPKMTETWKYNCPFYLYLGLFCYLSIDKSNKFAYIGFCDGHLMSKSHMVLKGTEKKLVRKFYADKVLN